MEWKTPLSAHGMVWAIVLTFCFSISGLQITYAETGLAVGNFEVHLGSTEEPLTSYQKENRETNSETTSEYMDLAIEFAQQGDAENAAHYAELYIKESLDTRFVNHPTFHNLFGDTAFIAIKEKYNQKFNAIHLFYLFSALIGLFIGIILNAKKTSNRTANYLISGFVLIHSVFILHIFLYLTNLKYQFPHILFMSTIFSFLYGPLIYFYVKCIAQQYRFRKKDIFHLIPTVVIAAIYLPVYLLPAEEKLKVMLHVGPIESVEYVTYTFLAKLLSLLIYGYFLVRIYRTTIRKNKRLHNTALKWKQTIIGLGMIYIASYAIYGLIISMIIPRSDFLYHLQVMAMAAMVLYVGVKAYLEPRIFTSEWFAISDKYRKSGLTQSYSLELKTQLLELLEKEKLYRKNDISLEAVAERLGTTRHNTSQVINEHFDLNFFDLINKYRISEASEILRNDIHQNLNIIDVAYEVGFNNKVTFNKSFKKNLSQTPSQFLLSQGK